MASLSQIGEAFCVVGMESWEITNERERGVDRFTLLELHAFPEYMYCPTPRFYILAISDVMHSKQSLFGVV
jgi:hypothetical protein